MVLRRVGTFFQDVGNAIENDPNIQKAKSFIDKTSQSIEEKSFASGLKRLSKGDFKQLESTMDTAQKLKEMGGKPHLAFKELLDKNPQLTNCKEFENSKIKDTVDSLKKDIIKDSFGKFEGFDPEIGKVLDRMSAEDGEMLLDKFQQMSSSDQRNCLQVFGALANRDCSAQFLSEFTTQLDPQEMINLTKSIKTLQTNRYDKNLLSIAEKLPNNNLREVFNSIKIIETLPSEQQKAMADRLNPDLLRSLQKVGENEQAILSKKFLALSGINQCKSISKDLASLTPEQLTLTAQNIKTLKSPKDLNNFILNLNDLTDDQTKQMAAALNKSEHKKVLLGILKQEKGQDRAVEFANVLSKDYSSSIQKTFIALLEDPGNESIAKDLSAALSKTYKDFNTRDKEVLAEVWAKNGSEVGKNFADTLQEIHKMAPESIKNEFLGEKLSTFSNDELNCLTKGLGALNLSEENAEAIAENLSKMQPDNLKYFAQSIGTLLVGDGETMPYVQHSNTTAERDFKESLTQILAQLDPNSMDILTVGIAFSLSNAAVPGQASLLSSAQEGIDSLLNDMAKRTSDQKNSLVYLIQARNSTDADAVTELCQLNKAKLDQLHQILENGGDGPVGIEAFTQLDAKSALLLTENAKNYSKTQTDTLKAYFSNPNQKTAINYMKSMMQPSSRAIFSNVALTDTQKNELEACMKSKNNPEVFPKNALEFLNGIKDPSTENQTKRTKKLNLDDMQKTLLLNWQLDPSPANALAFIKELKDKQINTSSHLEEGKKVFDDAKTVQDQDKQANAFMKLLAKPHPLNKARLSSYQRELAVLYLKNHEASIASTLMVSLEEPSTFVESAGGNHADSENFAKFVMLFDPKDAVVLKDAVFGEQGQRLISKDLNNPNTAINLADKVKKGGAEVFKNEVRDLVDTENEHIRLEEEKKAREAEEAAKKLKEEEDEKIRAKQAHSNSHKIHKDYNLKKGVDFVGNSESLTETEATARDKAITEGSNNDANLVDSLANMQVPPRQLKKANSYDEAKKHMDSLSPNSPKDHFEAARKLVQEAKREIGEIIQSWQKLQKTNESIINSLALPSAVLTAKSLEGATDANSRMALVMHVRENHSNWENVLQSEYKMSLDDINAALTGWEHAKTALRNSRDFLRNTFEHLQELPKTPLTDKCWDYCVGLAHVFQQIGQAGLIGLDYDNLSKVFQQAFSDHKSELPPGTVIISGNGSVTLNMGTFKNAMQSIYNEANNTAKQSEAQAEQWEATISKATISKKR